MPSKSKRNPAFSVTQLLLATISIVINLGLCITFFFLHYLSVCCPNTAISELISCVLQCTHSNFSKAFSYWHVLSFQCLFVGKYAPPVHISNKLNDYGSIFAVARNTYSICAIISPGEISKSISLFIFYL